MMTKINRTINYESDLRPGYFL